MLITITILTIIMIMALQNEGFLQVSDYTKTWLYNTGSLAIPDMNTGDRCVSPLLCYLLHTEVSK